MTYIRSSFEATRPPQCGTVPHLLFFFWLLKWQRIFWTTSESLKGADDADPREIVTENMRRFLSKLWDDRRGQKQDTRYRSLASGNVGFNASCTKSFVYVPRSFASFISFNTKLLNEQNSGSFLEANQSDLIVYNTLLPYNTVGCLKMHWVSSNTLRSVTMWPWCAS